MADLKKGTYATAKKYVIEHPESAASKAWLRQMGQGTKGDKVKARHIAEQQALHQTKKRK